MVGQWVQVTTGVCASACLGRLFQLTTQLNVSPLLLDSGAQGQQLRSMLALMRWLQLYMLADPAAAQSDVAVDLEGVFNGAFTKGNPAAGQSCHVACFPELVSHPLSGLGDAIVLRLQLYLSLLK